MSKASFAAVFFFLLFLGQLPLQAQDLLRATLVTPAQTGILAETCSGPYQIVLTRGADNSESTEIFISTSGSATINTDFDFGTTIFPVIMDEGTTEVIIPIEVVNDGTPEGAETLEIELAFLAGVQSGDITLSTLIVDAFDVTIEGPDTVQACQYQPITLTATGEGEIHWFPEELFDPNTGNSATLTPIASAWYYAFVGEDDECGDRDSVYVEVNRVDIVGLDTLFICKGEEVILTTTVFGETGTISWSPADTTLSDPTSLAPIADPTITTTYIITNDLGFCVARDTVTVRVDSIPTDLSISIAPEKDFYCEGEIVALFSPSFDSLSYPDILFNWVPKNNTYLTSDSLLNTSLNLRDTTLYIREVTNNGCTSSDSILINVVPASVPLSVMDTTLCPGSSFQTIVLADVDEPEWTPENGLSCTKCLDPIVTVSGELGSTLIWQFSGKVNGCPVGANLVVQIPPPQPIFIQTSDPTVCEGDQVTLTITNPASLSDFNWTILTGSASFSCNDCASPVLSVNDDGTITIQLTASTSDPNFCGAFGEITINPGQTQQITGPAVVVCPDGSTIITTGDPTLTDVQWDVISGDIELSCTECPSPTITVHTPGLIRFLAESANPDICSVSGSVTASFFNAESSDIILSPDPATTDIAQGTEVTAMLNVNGAPPTNLMWIVNGNPISGTGNPITFTADQEINLVQVTFTNSFGCTQVDTISFTTVPPSYMVPNVFTPNNDMLNDNFRIIINGNIQLTQFLIFNRWGQKVYDAPEGDLDGWDGTIKGEQATSDTYVYLADLVYPDGRIETIKGDVILLR